nr:mechanosensitive ion channel family protein [Salidesulfovibrio brasiliensis]
MDDVVIVEGEWGRIEEITFTYAVVRIWDLRRLIVPLTYFLERPFQNWTRSKADLIGSVFLHADYTVPVDDMRQELERICEESRHLWDGKTCTMQVTDAGPETITLRALVSAANSSAAWDLRCLVREKLVAYLRDNHPGSLPRKRLRMHAEKDKDGLEY